MGSQTSTAERDSYTLAEDAETMSNRKLSEALAVEGDTEARCRDR